MILVFDVDYLVAGGVFHVPSALLFGGVEGVVIVGIGEGLSARRLGIVFDRKIRIFIDELAA